MRIECYGTGSKGNHYRIIDSKGNILLIELGTPLNEILNGLDVSKVNGVLVSHNHKDHNKNDNVKKLADFNLPIITIQNGVVGKVAKLGAFSIIPIPCMHNVKCYGYLINVDNYTIMFATDTKKIPKIGNLKIDIYMVEVNYIREMVEKVLFEMDADSQKLSYESRVLMAHNSLENTIDYFKSLNYKPLSIITIHKSDNENHYQQEQVSNELSRFCDKFYTFENNMFVDFGRR